MAQNREEFIKRLEAMLEAAKKDNDDFEGIYFWSEGGDIVLGEAHASVITRMTAAQALVGDISEEDDDDE